MGIAFQASHEIGLIVAAAVLAHDFADGLNTVNVVVKNGGSRRFALRWLAVDAAAPLVGAALSLLVQPDRASWRSCWRCSAASSCISAPAGCCPKAIAPGRALLQRSQPWRGAAFLVCQ